jgi:hypothetical protein
MRERPKPGAKGRSAAKVDKFAQFAVQCTILVPEYSVKIKFEFRRMTHNGILGHFAALSLVTAIVAAVVDL